MVVKPRMSENSTASSRFSPTSRDSGLLKNFSMTSLGTYFWKMLRISCSRWRASTALKAKSLIWL